MSKVFSGKTKSGFSYKIPEENFDNMEFIDTLAEASDDNPLMMSKAIKMLLGDAQKKAFYDHLRTKSGNVPVEAAMNEITEIIESCGDDGKNSDA